MGPIAMFSFVASFWINSMLTGCFVLFGRVFSFCVSSVVTYVALECPNYFCGPPWHITVCVIVFVGLYW